MTTGLPTTEDKAFMARAACRRYSPALFDTDTTPTTGRTPMRGTVHIGGTEMTRAERIERARAVCTACPVLDDCAVYIKRFPEPEGVWAATIPEERAV